MQVLARQSGSSNAYDGLGNRTNSGDDQNGFYDRSLGVEAHDAARPYQLTSALIGVGSHQGSLTASYDAAGNQTGLSVLRDAASCMPIGANCNQRYAYEWDEYNRLTRARRWDGADVGTANDPLPETAAAADLVYAYNGADSRTRTTVVHPGVADDVHTLYIYASLELRRTGFDGENNDYLLDATHERVYLGANGERLAQLRPDEAGLPAYTGETRVFFEFADHLGSANTVVDKRTGELVEKRTYTAYGSIESDHRQDRWGQFREDYGFTTKEEDVEVGLTYFGKRFYNPRLGRWLNADPLAIHSPGEADLNLYAYVSGNVLGAFDPLGLCGESWGKWAPCAVWQTTKGTAEGVVREGLDTAKATVAAANPWHISETYQAVKQKVASDYSESGAKGVVRGLSYGPVVDEYRAGKRAEARGDYHAAGVHGGRTAFRAAAILQIAKGAVHGGVKKVLVKRALATAAAEVAAKETAELAAKEAAELAAKQALEASLDEGNVVGKVSKRKQGMAGALVTADGKVFTGRSQNVGGGATSSGSAGCIRCNSGRLARPVPRGVR